MKRNTFISMMMVLATLMGTQSVMAQEHTEKVDMNTGLVVWTGSLAEEVANTNKFFFLVEFKEELDKEHKELYVGARGDYGVQGILSSVGMRLQLVSSNRNVDLRNQPSQNCYQFVTRIKNADGQASHLGDRMGIDSDFGYGKSVYLDRSGNRSYSNDGNNRVYTNFPNWQLNYVKSYKRNIRYKDQETESTVEVNTYTIQNVETQKRNGGEWWDPRYTGEYKPTYIKVDNGRLVSTEEANDATRWIIVSEEDFQDAMAEVTWGEVDLGVFVMDATFGRDNKDGIYWVWSTNGEGGPAVIENGKTLDGMQLEGNIHWHQRNQDVMCNGVELENGISGRQVGTNLVGSNNANTNYDHNACRANFAQYYAAEIYNEKNSLTQTLYGQNIPNLIDGLYKLTAQALYYDDDSGTSNEGVAYFVVKREVLGEDGVTVVDESTEYMPIKPMMNEEDLGRTITPHSGVSAGYVFNNNSNAYLLTTFVEISGNVRLTIGIEQRKAKGWTVIGNVHFYAHGKQALMIDEDWGETSTMTYKEGDRWYEGATGNPYSMAKWYDNYDYPSTVYYQRTFAVNAWNTICMPMDLTGRQVRQAFGADALVCGFLGQKNGDPDGCLLFSRALDLDKDENMNKVVVKAGYPYIIYVTNQPQREPDKVDDQGNKYLEVEVGNGQFNHTVKIDGKCYTIPGVIKEQYNGYHEKQSDGTYVLRAPMEIKPDGLDPTPNETEAKGKYPYDPSCSSNLHFVGSFYHKVINKSSIHGSANANGSNDYWVITKGDMYHLTGGRDWNIWATYAYLYRPYNSGSAPAKELSFAIDDGYGIREIATHIEGLYFDKGDNIEDNEVYNLSGTKVGKGTLDTLPKGIYILNGRKYVKK